MIKYWILMLLLVGCTKHSDTVKRETELTSTEIEMKNSLSIEEKVLFEACSSYWPQRHCLVDRANARVNRKILKGVSYE